ncbi:MAG: hypothetical protein ACKPJD_01380, partial [Planctomycetaceae bacterium]
RSFLTVQMTDGCGEVAAEKKTAVWVFQPDHCPENATCLHTDCAVSCRGMFREIRGFCGGKMGVT